MSKTRDWKKAHEAIESAIISIAWPIGSSSGLVIPRSVSIKPNQRFIDKRGKVTIWRGEKNKTVRNGVVPLRQLFRLNLESSGWKAEETLSLKGYFEKIRVDKKQNQISKYPVAAVDAVRDALHEGVGDFDFWLRSDTGFRTVVEWETGNISSSHRALNKMCLALIAGLVDGAVLVVPSNHLSSHLTDRIGNVKELQPYFYFWSRVGQLVDHGLLAIIEVEHDFLTTSADMRDFIPTGEDGNAFRTGIPIARPRSRKLK